MHEDVSTTEAVRWLREGPLFKRRFTTLGRGCGLQYQLSASVIICGGHKSRVIINRAVASGRRPFLFPTNQEYFVLGSILLPVRLY